MSHILLLVLLKSLAILPGVVSSAIISEFGKQRQGNHNVEVSLIYIAARNTWRPCFKKPKLKSGIII